MQISKFIKKILENFKEIKCLQYTWVSVGPQVIRQPLSLFVFVATSHVCFSLYVHFVFNVFSERFFSFDSLINASLFFFGCGINLKHWILGNCPV